MASITVNFPNPLNVSVQIGDNLYYNVPVNNQGGTNHPSDATGTAPILMGVVTSITPWNGTVARVTVGTMLNPTPAVTPVYWFFSKDNNANLTSLIGYYAEVELRNNSSTASEIYQITADAFDSSR